MSEPHAFPSPGRRLAIIVIAMLGTVMQVLDTTIANVALPHMQSTLGATQDQINWVLTSYIVATAVVVPATGFLDQTLGRRTLFSVAIAGFTISSMLCGLAWSLPVMIIARVLQGLFGAVIAPMAQAIMYDSNPPEERTRAMTIWSMGVMVAPVLGPVVGGYLTDAFNWRWVFFINVPIGLFATVGAWFMLPSTKVPRQAFDVFGYALIVTALCAMQLMLDRGSELDWFDSSEIWFELLLSLGALWMFTVHTMTAANPIIPLGVFKDRNFLLSSLFVMVNSGSMMAGAALTAPLLQGLLGFSTIQSGLMMMPRGLAMAASMLLAGRLVDRIDPRLLIGCGVVVAAIGQYLMTGLTTEMDQRPIIIAGFVQGAGLGLTFLPLNLMAFATIDQRIRTHAASIASLARSYSGSVTIALSSALLVGLVQVSHSDLVSHLTNIKLPILVSGFLEQYGFHGSDALMVADVIVNKQAAMIAYNDVFYAMSIITIAGLPLLLLVRRARKSRVTEIAAKPLPDAH
jgi:DHA2 family multidrug resistance protein